MYLLKELQNVKNDIENNIGQEVLIKSNRGRQRVSTHKAVITNVYPSIFTVRTKDDAEFSRDMSFSYADVLTKFVDITLT